MRSARLPSLDALRGLAIMLVLGHNLQTLQEPVGLLNRALEWSMDRGWVGVQLFFALSGFLITGILLDTNKQPHYFSDFFKRRARRIFPLYYLCLTLLLVVFPLLGWIAAERIPSLNLQLPYWLYYSNWTAPFHGDIDLLSHFWSLAVEEQFYLLWPFLLYRRTARQALTICLTVAVIALLSRTAMLYGGAGFRSLYEFSNCRMDALALGGAMAALLRIPSTHRWLVSHSTKVLVTTAVTLLVGAAITRGYPRTGGLSQTIGYSWLAVVCAMLVLSAWLSDQPLTGLRQGLLNYTTLRALGKYSYGIYIIHKPLDVLIGKPLLASLALNTENAIVSIGYCLSAGLASFALAYFSYEWFEVKFLTRGHQANP